MQVVQLMFLPINTAGAASSTPTVCVNTAMTPVTHITTGAIGIGTANGITNRSDSSMGV